MGAQSCEVWNNLGLCAFHSGQYDVALPCMERALAAAGDAELPDVWYNLGQVGWRWGGGQVGGGGGGRAHAALLAWS
jgi:tetratricopeptide repeat protein 8